MMGKVNVERTNEYRQVVQQYITEHPGSQTNQISKILHVGHRRASSILMMLTNCGDIYRGGNHNKTRYWISAAACKKDGVCEEAEQETFESRSKGSSSRHNQHHRTTCSSMVFLSKRRPQCINTVFEECKQNFGILPVLQVMAARRVACKIIRG